MIRDESYIHIGGWMLSKLKLKGNELLVYATIYSFTNGTDEHCYKGSAGYLSERCGLQRRQTMNVLKSLEGKGYIERKVRTENGIKFVDYYTPYAKIAQGGYVNFAHHNNSSFDNNTQNEGNSNLPIVDDKSLSNSFKQKNVKRVNVDGKQYHAPLDKIKNSDDIRDLLSEEEIGIYNIQLRILLKMINLGYKINKTKTDLINDFEWLKNKAKLYGLVRGDGSIAWNTFYQKIDKWYDWHTENNKPVKNFKTSIIPFISK